MLRTTTLLACTALVWVAFHLFVVACEEPTLTATFGGLLPGVPADSRALVAAWLIQGQA